MAELYDTTKDFLVAHYMGGRDDSEFWRYIKTGATMTPFVQDILDMSKTKMPTNRDFSLVFGAPDMSLWSYVLAGTNNLKPEISQKVFNGNEVKIIGLKDVKKTIDGYQTVIDNKLKSNLKYRDFIDFIKRTAK